MDQEQINILSNKVIGCAIKVHSSLGPGFIERIYVKAMCCEFGRSGISFEREKIMKVKYGEFLLGEHRLDFFD